MEQYEHLQPLANEYDAKEEARIFNEISAIDGASEYFNALLSRDMKLHFQCPKEQQDLVRGGFYRTEYFTKLLKKYSVIDK